MELTPPGATWAIEDCKSEPIGLLCDELCLVERAWPKRRAEFAAGRRAARTAMAKLGIAPVPVFKGEHGEPLWPESVVGSITHTDDVAIALVGHAQVIESVGIDLEPNEPLEGDLLPTVCTDAELEWLGMQEPAVRGRLGRLFFAAKESLYKCQYPLSGQFLEFHDVELRLEQAAGRFIATAPRRAGLSEFRGRFGFAEKSIVAITISQPRADSPALLRAVEGPSCRSLRTR